MDPWNTFKCNYTAASDDTEGKGMRAPMRTRRKEMQQETAEQRDKIKKKKISQAR